MLDPLSNRSPDQLYRLAERSLAPYIRLQWKEWQRGQHINYLINVLHQVEQGKIDRAIILMPPRHSKSVTVSQFFPAWCLGKHPDWHIISASYGQDLATGFGKKVRDLMKDPRHSRIFPGSRVSADSSARDHFSTTQEGQYFAVGRGSAVVGRGAHLFIVDDPIKDKIEATNSDLRSKLHEWFSTVAYTRLMKGGRIVICQTLWNEDDLAGWLMREHADDGWHVFKMPAIAEQDEGWRKAGDALWPEMFDIEALERIRRQLTSEDWNSLYQQRCVSDEGNVFKMNWWRECHALDVPKFKSQGMTRYILVDPASSKKRGSDYTSMWVVGLGLNEQMYLLDGVRDKIPTPSERCDRLFALHKAHFPVSRVLYEHYGMQGDIATIRQRQLTPPVNFFSVTPVGGALAKTERIKQLEPLFREHRIHIPGSIWSMSEGRLQDLVPMLRDEYRAFPNAPHDDMMDALSRIRSEDVTLDYPQPEEQSSSDNDWQDGSEDRGGWLSQ